MKFLYLFLFPVMCIARNPDIDSLQDNPSYYQDLTDSTAKFFIPLEYTSIEPFPILMYDTDIGFGYGGKVFFLNCMGYSESFDVLGFNSTKGERWYRIAVSFPDLEARQGKIYPLALDIVGDYDKLIKNSFFGIGNDSKSDEREYYTKQTLDLSFSISRGFSTEIVGQLGIRYRSIENFNFSPGGQLNRLNGMKTDSTVSSSSVLAVIRYDSRNSFINPSEGILFQADIESGFRLMDKDISSLSTTLSLQSYNLFFFPKTVLATRLMFKSVSGDNIPVQMLLSLGGNKTLRGYPQDRFMDKSLLLLNSELRFPIFRRFGGLVGLDAGEVFRSFSQLSLKSCRYNLAAGLRFYMENFVVRLDTGFSKETMGLYFNFGHIF